MSLTYFAVLNTIVLSMCVLASGTVNGAVNQLGSDWNADDARAAVFGEPKKTMPKGTTQAVELLRFVTAYKKGIEALVDITPYSALLRASADTDGDLTFFAFIDTWVGNNTPQVRNVMQLDSAGKCTPGTKTEDAWGDGGRSGNGWQVDADLVFWPRKAAVDTRPRESITISAGYYGSYSIGSITAHEATVSNGGYGVELLDGADLTGALDAEVYPCPNGAKDMEHGIKMGELAKRVRSSNGSAGHIIEETYNQLVGDATVTLNPIDNNADKKQVIVNTGDAMLAPGMKVWYEKDDLLLDGDAKIGEYPSGEPIGKVIAVNQSRATIEITGSCLPGKDNHWLPRLKLEKWPNALAHARTAADSMKTVKGRMHRRHTEDEDPDHFVSLLSKQKGASKVTIGGEDESIFKPFLVGRTKDHTYVPLSILGRVDLSFLRKDGADCAPPMLSFLELGEKAEEIKDKKEPGGAIATAERMLGQAAKSSATAQGQMLQMNEGDKVCVLARRATGRVFERTFDMPTFTAAAAAGAAGAAAAAKAGNASNAGDHVLLQFAVTGHGWSGSTEQCGEFCHAVYAIKVNGHSVANVTEWRDDCEKNPVADQYGTWEIHRDGWCPGSVEPGLYIDMTKFAKNGKNHISVDLKVWNSKTRRYERYTNYGNYLSGGDGAVLFVGATMFIYDGAAADAIKKQDNAYSAAESALRDGSSMPQALQPPEKVNSAFGSSLLQKGEASSGTAPAKAVTLASPTATSKKHHVKRHHAHHRKKTSKHTSFLAKDTKTHGHSLSSFEDRAPWYVYDEKQSGPPGAQDGAKVVSAFKDGLIQINTREIRAKVKKSALPFMDWDFAALHLRLETPSGDGLSMDNWDRMGSLGLIYEEHAKSSTGSSKVLLRPSQFVSGRPSLTTSWRMTKGL